MLRSLALLLTLWLLTQSAHGQALTPEENRRLTGYLQEIARRWHQPSVDAANAMFTRCQCDWSVFFAGYFRDHPMTDDLRAYLAYPTFSWFEAKVHGALQNGLYPVLTDQLESTTRRHRQAQNLGAAMQQDASLRANVFNMHRFLQVYLAQEQPHVNRARLLAWYEGYLTRYPELFRDPPAGTAPERRPPPFLGALRVQVLNNLLEGYYRRPIHAGSHLSPAEASRLSRLTGLTGAKLAFWKEHHILVIDNGHFDALQFEVLSNYFSSIPRGLPRPWVLTDYDALGATGKQAMTLFASNSINIFGNRVGTTPENEFPDDVPPRQSDLFLACLSHEANHVVNGQLIEKSAALAARQKALISAAGNQPLNYLRSMFPGDTFPQAPQEFFASIANEWFCDSGYTLELALRRFRQGRREPLNQALFFAEVYSQGDSFTWLYSVDSRKRLTCRKVPVGRDRNGHICSLKIGDKDWRFTLDKHGNVLQVHP